MSKQILVDPEKFLGEPYLEGTQVPVSAIVQWAEAGLGPEEIAEVYPELTVEDVKTALHYKT
ncbi:MAG: hypothetical protein B6I34_02660 [Anaerolineaceae bacterium 4572_32.1]|nr:MAG: hypothetical protein B6I34_02660 [Anaerolineaceae bacterium 4572_32.1]